MQANNLGFFSARGAGRVAVGVFVVCALAVSGLIWGGSDADGKIKVDPRSPINAESLEGLEMFRLDLSPRFARWNSYYCGNYSYDAAWFGFVGGRDVCMIYKAGGNEFWLLKGDLFIPLATDIVFLSLKVGETRFVYFNCDEDVLRCANPVMMPQASGLGIAGDGDLVIETVVAESADLESEGISRLRSRISSLPNLPWFARLCYVTDTLSYSDNCEDKHASPKNFAIRIADLDTRNSFTLTRYWDSTDRSDPAGFGSGVYLRDIETTSPVEVSCDISEAGFSASHLEGYHIYSCIGHTLKFEGNFVVLGSDATSAASGGTITPLPKPEVRVIAMEVTQGVQNWNNTLTLVRGRRTIVRAFMETTVRSREITAKLRGTIIEGTERTPLGMRYPINNYQEVTIKPQVTDRRNDFHSSLNFILPDHWVELGKYKRLYLELVFAENNIICEDRCSELIGFKVIDHFPKIVMVPLSIKNSDDSKSTTDPSLLDEQFKRIISIMPFPTNSNYISIEQAPRTYPSDLYYALRPISRRESLKYYTSNLTFLQAEGPKNIIYLGVLPGEPDQTGDGNLPSGKANTIPKIGDSSGNAAAWYTGGDDNGRGIDSLKGIYRNIGSHELGHLLGQSHPIRIRDSKNKISNGLYSGECGEKSRSKEVYPNYYQIGTEGHYDENDAGWRPTLGPLGDPYTEVWGLDTRLAATTNHFSQVNYNLILTVIDPREVFSILSYCNSESQMITQGGWMDSYYHEKIIYFLSKLTGFDYSADNAVESDMISGMVVFSSDEDQVELKPIFSRPRFEKSIDASNVDEFTLELRDKFGSIVRSIPFPVYRNENEKLHDSPLRAAFSVIVANPPKYDSIAVIKDSEEITVVERSLNSPAVSIHGVSTGEEFTHDDIIDISWSGSDFDGDRLIYRLFYSIDGGVNYSVLSLETEANSLSLRAGDLVGSNRARIGISVSDGTRSTFSETPVFSISGHRPEIELVAPMPNSVFSSDQTIVLEAFGYDLEDGYLGSSAFNWYSSIDRDLGTGKLLVLSASELSLGQHEITLSVSDSDRMVSTASVAITINSQNTTPIAVEDTIYISLNEIVHINVLDNDSDLERDIDTDTLSFVSIPVLGDAKIIISQTKHSVVEYVSHTQGTDSFYYEICDYDKKCDTAQITVTILSPDCTIVGTEEDDILVGTSGSDVICSLGGNDIIDAKAGDDTIFGGEGNDTIYARVGNDRVYGGPGDDLILGHRGDDNIDGNTGDDIIYGGEGNDTLTGNEGSDELYGEAGNDTINGNAGADKIHGGRGDDTIWGAEGDDLIRGNAGKDTIYPGSGKNTILGTTSEDKVYE